MKQTFSMTLIAAALVGSISSTAVQAADEGFYGYVSAGSGKSDRKAETDTALINAGAVFSSSSNSSDTALKLQVGYQFNRYLAVEGGYIDMGKYTYHALASVPAGATRDGTVKVSGWNLGAVGRLPVSDAVAVFAKAGAFAYSLTYSCQGTGVACVAPNRSNSGTPIYYGIGLDWNFNPSWFARAEYEIFPKIGEAFNATGTTGTTRADVKMASIGIGYKF